MDNQSTTGDDTTKLTALPAPPRTPTLTLVSSNPTPRATRGTSTHLRVVKRIVHSTPPSPPSIPPTGSTPIRRAA